MELHSHGLGITMFLTLHLQIHHIAGHHVGHEDGQSVNFCDGLAFCRDIGYEHTLEQRQRLLLSRHIIYNECVNLNKQQQS